MVNVTIYKKHSFIEYLGPTVSISSLSTLVLSNIDKILGISEDNDHLIVFSPNGNYNELTSFETNKKYLIIANSDYPKFVLYSYNNATPTVTPTVTTTNTPTPTPTISLTPTPTVTPTPPMGWTSRTLPVNAQWSAISEGLCSVLAVARNSNIGAYSSGYNWSQYLLPVSSNWIAVSYAYISVIGSRYIAVSQDGDIAMSNYGNSWIASAKPNNTNYSWRCLAGGANVFVVISDNSENGINGTVYARSDDGGVSWVTYGMPAYADWGSITFGKNKFVAIAINSDKVATSEDGISWTLGTMPISAFWNDVVYSNNQFMAITRNQIAKSTDGLTWTLETLPVDIDAINISSLKT
jgi:hypothetical protein